MTLDRQRFGSKGGLIAAQEAQQNKTSNEKKVAEERRQQAIDINPDVVLCKHMLKNAEEDRSEDIKPFMQAKADAKAKMTNPVSGISIEDRKLLMAEYNKAEEAQSAAYIEFSKPVDIAAKEYEEAYQAASLEYDQSLK